MRPHDQRQVRVNWKLFAVLLLGAIVAAGGIFFLRDYQIKRTSKELLQWADHAAENGRLERAVFMLEEYTKYQPKDIEGREKLALMVDRLAESMSGMTAMQDLAIQKLGNVVAKDPDRTSIRELLAQRLMRLKRYNQAATEYEEELLKRKPEHGEYLYQLAICKLRIGGKDAKSGKSNEEIALELLERARKSQPDLLDAYLESIEVLRLRQEGAGEVNRLIAEMVKNNEANPRAYLERARLNLLQWIRMTDAQAREELGKQIDADLAKARELGPEDPENLMNGALLVSTRGRLPEARGMIETAIKVKPKDRRGYILGARLERMAGETAAELAILERGVKELPEDLDLVWLLTDAQVRNQKLNEARAGIESLRTAPGFPKPVLLFLQGSVLFAENKLAEALPVLEQARSGVMSELGMPQEMRTELATRTNLLLGECWLKQGKLAESRAAFQEALRLDDKNMLARQRLAVVLLAQGENDPTRTSEAVSEYRTLASQAPELRTALIRSRLIQNQRRQRAGQELGVGEWSDIDSLIEQELAARPDATEVILMQVDSLTMRGEVARAIGVVERALQRMRGKPELWTTLALLQGRQKEWAKAAATLDEAEKELGKQQMFRLSRIRLIGMQGEGDAVKKLDEELAAVASLPEQDRPAVYQALVDAADILKDSGASSRYVEAWLAGDASNVRARIEKLEQAARSNDVQQIERAVEDLKKVSGESAPEWRLGEVYGLLLKARSKNARPEEVRSAISIAKQRLQELDRLRPQSAEVARLLGEFAKLENKSIEAEEYYQKAYEWGGQRVAVARELALLKVRNGKLRAANELMQQFGEQSREALSMPLEMRQLTAELALENGEFDRAVAIAKEIVPSDSKDASLHLWKGGVLVSAKKPDEADAVFRRAVELAPEDPRTHMALVRYLAGQGKQQQLNAAIEAFQKTLNADSSPLIMAELTSIIGKREEAAKLYQEALKANPNDALTLLTTADWLLKQNAFAQAEPLLRRVLDPSVKAAPPQVQAARRALSLLLAQRNVPKLTAEALALVEQNLAELPNSSADRLARARLKSVDPRTQDAALIEFESLAQERRLTKEDQFVVCKVLAQQGAWDDARQRMESLLKEAPSEPRYLTWMIARLLEQNQPDQATPYLEQLRQAAPKAASTKILTAQYLAARKQPDAAAKVLLELAKTDGSAIPAVAETFEKLGQPEEAERLLKSFHPQGKESAAKILMAGFLTRQKRFDEAVVLLNTMWDEVPASQLGNLYLQVMEADRTNKELRDELARVFEAHSSDPKNEPVLRNLIAVVKIRKGEYDAARALYEQVLQTNPDDVQALNNLAWLKAFVPGQEAAAMPLIQKAIEILGEESRLLDTRALVAGRMGQFDAAIRDLEDALKSKLKDEEGSFRFHYAWALAKSGKLEKAKEERDRARELGFLPDRVEPLEEPIYAELKQLLDQAR